MEARDQGVTPTGGRPGRLAAQRCEACGKSGLRIRDSKPRPGGMRRLRVECVDCGHRFSLLEAYGEERGDAQMVERPARGVSVTWEGEASRGVLSPRVVIDGWEVRTSFVLRWLDPPDVHRSGWHVMRWDGGITPRLPITSGGPVDVAMVQLVNTKLQELHERRAKPRRPYQPFRASRRASTSASE